MSLSKRKERGPERKNGFRAKKYPVPGGKFALTRDRRKDSVARMQSEGASCVRQGCTGGWVVTTK